MLGKMILSSVLLVSLFVNGFFAYTNASQEDAAGNQENLQEQYPLLSKRILMDNPNDIIINFIPLRRLIRKYVEEQNGKVGVYFEYLPSGTSIGVNDTNEVRLVSLSKVPLTMSIFKKIERGQLSPNDTVVLEEGHIDKQFGTLWKRGVGARVTISELVRYALIESDNTAYYALFERLTAEEVNEVYRNLDIPIAGEGNKSQYPTVSPKNYSSIFRSLYLSSFLSKENSNHILDLLTRTIYSDKMTAAIPQDVKVAHKIGVFARKDTDKSTFIDCGVVYVPARPYILCMFVLDAEEKAREHMTFISKVVYEYVSRIEGGG